MAEGQVGNEAGDLWLADQLVSNLGLEGAIQFCRVRAWDDVLEYVNPLKETAEAIPTALDRSEALAAPTPAAFLRPARGHTLAPMPFPTMPDPAADREHDRWNPERETLELATIGATRALGPDHRATRALAQAAITMAPADLWWARLAIKNLKRDEREAVTFSNRSPNLG